MSTATLLLFILASAVAIVTPGPTVLLAMSNGSRHGVRLSLIHISAHGLFGFAQLPHGAAGMARVDHQHHLVARGDHGARAGPQRAAAAQHVDHPRRDVGPDLSLIHI